MLITPNFQLRIVRKIVWLSTSLVVAGMLATGCSGGSGKSRENKSGTDSKVPITALVLKPRAIENTVVTTGTLLANEEVELRPEISGRVVGIYFEEGSRVEKGALLLKIDDSELKGQLKGKEFQEKLAADDEGRKRVLSSTNSISQEEYDRSVYALKLIQAEKEVIQSRLDKTEIRSPFDGVVGLRHVSSGSYVSSNMLVAILQNINPMKVEFSIPEKHAKKLKNGTAVLLEVGDSQKKYRGTVYAVESKIDVGTRTIKARAQIANPGRELIPGSFAKVVLTLEKLSGAIAIPSQAVIPELSGEKVFVCANGKARAVPIKTGIRTDSLVQIIAGLQPFDTLALTGLLQLVDGSLVEIKQIQSQ